MKVHLLSVYPYLTKTNAGLHFNYVNSIDLIVSMAVVSFLCHCEQGE